jgi:hypothetical protein
VNPLPEFNWNGAENTFEWILKTAEEARHERERVLLSKRVW